MSNEPPYVSADGTHVMPVVRLWDVEGNDLRLSEGSITWSPKEGVHCRFRFNGPRSEDFEQLLNSEQLEGAVGKMVRYSKPHAWTAQLANSGTVEGYEFSCSSTHTSRSLMASSECWDEVSGIPGILLANLPVDNRIAFDGFGPSASRLFVEGFECKSHWPRFEKASWTRSDGSIFSSGIASIQLSENPLVVLKSCKNVYNISDAVFVCQDIPCPTSTDELLVDQGVDFQDFLSLFYGRPTRGFWREWDIEEGRIKRLYFGLKKRFIKDIGRPRDELMPLSEAVEHFKHGDAVVGQVPLVFATMLELNRTTYVSDFLLPIWTAIEICAEDQVALACVGLERLRKIVFDRKASKSSPPKPFKQKDWEQLLERLTATFNEFVSTNKEIADELRASIVLKKLMNLNQPPNQDQIELAFNEIGIEFSDDEKKAVAARNNCFHGRLSLRRDASPDDFDELALLFDRLRTLLFKAALRLAGYQGPYIDYGSRPAEGNHEIKLL